MDILFISPSYYPSVGGVEYVVKSIAERLAKKSDVTVLAGYKGEKPLEEEINKVHVIRWPVFSPKNAYHIPRRRKELLKLLNDFRCDAAHVHNAHSVFPVWCGLNVKASKLVFTLHYHGEAHTFFRRILWRFWKPYLIKLLRKSVVHAVSKFEAKLIERDFNVKALVIENGVEENLAEIQWKPEDYGLYSGRIEKYKNVDRLAKIVKILNMKLLIIGDGSYKRKLEKNLKSMNLEYEMIPFQPYEKYLEILSKAGFFGLLSKKEAFSIVTNEANAIGVPAVVAKPWGETFSERRRILIVDLKESDEEIAKKILDFLEKASKQEKSYVPTWNEVVERYVSELYI